MITERAEDVGIWFLSHPGISLAVILSNVTLAAHQWRTR